MTRYKIHELIPKKLYPEKSDFPIDNKYVKNKILSAQRIIEGQNFEIRKNLRRYSYIIEQQRLIIHNKRQDVLLDKPSKSYFREELFERYSKLLPGVGEPALKQTEKSVVLYQINKCWADYLDYITYIREFIHLVNIGSKNPLDEFIVKAIDAFDKMLMELNEEVLGILSRAEITAGGIDMEKEGLRNPSSTWTYIVDDGAEQLGIIPACTNPISVALIVTIPLVLILAIYNRFFNKKEVLK